MIEQLGNAEHCTEPDDEGRTGCNEFLAFGETLVSELQSFAGSRVVSRKSVVAARMQRRVLNDEEEAKSIEQLISGLWPNGDAINVLEWALRYAWHGIAPEGHKFNPLVDFPNQSHSRALRLCRRMGCKTC